MANVETEVLLTCALAATHPRPLPTVCDWKGLLAAAEAHGLLPLANRLVRDSDWPEEAKRMFRERALVAAFRSVAMSRELARVVARLQATGMTPIVMKGPALAHAIYPHPSLRPYADLDIWCREEDWTPTHEVLLELGYQSVWDLKAPPPKVDARKAYYHSQYHNHELGIHVEVHYDLWTYGLRPSLGELFWQRALPVTIEGVTTRMTATEEQIIHLCVHLQHHGYSRLIWFTDLALLVVGTDRVDWAFLVKAAKREGVGVFVYYSLFYLNRLLDVAAPPDVMAALRPNRLQAFVHEWFWPTGSLLALRSEDHVHCDFHEVPLGTELLRNAVLTGRRLEKLKYLTRLLTPSSDWLGYYYATRDPAILLRRRLLHAPKLMGRVVGELVNAAWRAVMHGTASL